jgi:hypothetical protein
MVSGSSARLVAADSHGRNAIEFLGRILQNANQIDSYGYLNYVSGLPESSLFTAGLPRNESTARFTYRAIGTIKDRYVNANMIVTVSIERFTVYFNKSAKADWKNPASFAKGQIVAAARVRDQNMLNVQAPNLGIGMGAADATQLNSVPFILGGHAYSFGRKGMTERFSTSGEGRRTSVQPSISQFVIAGNVVVTR